MCVGTEIRLQTFRQLCRTAETDAMPAVDLIGREAEPPTGDVITRGVDQDERGHRCRDPHQVLATDQWLIETEPRSS
jgi:hypothetical protein